MENPAPIPNQGSSKDGATFVDPVKDCFECHLSGAKESGFVFHKYAE